MMADDFSAERPPPSPPVVYTHAPPLGGMAPVEAGAPPQRDRQDILLTAFLLISAVVAGAASLMPWRDFGARFGASAIETGWVRADGSLGRGWTAVVLGVVIAGAGVLIASGRAQLGRWLAVTTGVVMSALAIVEWGFGTSGVRAGPGLGLWVLLGLGVVVVVAVGNATPPPAPTPSTDMSAGSGGWSAPG